MLFDLVNIDYRKNYYKEKILNIYQENIFIEIFKIYKVHIYCSKINCSDNSIDIINWFEKAENLFSFEEDYGLMYNFIELSYRLGFVYMKYEKEENVIEDIKFLSKNLVEKFKKAKSIEEKYKLLEDGIDMKYNIEKKWYGFWK